MTSMTTTVPSFPIVRRVLNFEYELNSKTVEFPAAIAILEALCDRFTDEELLTKQQGQHAMYNRIERLLFPEFPTVHLETQFFVNYYGDQHVHFIPRSEEQALRQRAKEIVAELY